MNQVSEWSRLWWKPVRKHLNRVGIPASDVEDLAQEVFLRLIRYPSDSVIENPPAYLFRIASNVANEWRRRCRVSKPHDDSWLETLLIEPEGQPENSFERRQWNEHVNELMNALPPRQREVLMLHVYDELTYKQIAERLGMTNRLVLRDLTRAYSYLRNNLRDEL